ncbi:hypothetical protein KPC45_00185 [Klebsiella pneumoniae subsp. pneumoniae]|nr:hypothetical protein KPC45_00185 [Klebsiella pneumoniae subsp. pneumoniae]
MQLLLLNMLVISIIRQVDMFAIFRMQQGWVLRPYLCLTRFQHIVSRRLKILAVFHQIQFFVKICILLHKQSFLVIK